MKYKIILLGPQGSGKGTQATLMSQALGLPAISMGELLRMRAARAETDEDRRIGEIQRAGDLVSDQVALETLKAHLEQMDDAQGYILDGYPRNSAQAEVYLSFDTPTHVIFIDIPREESMQRLTKRATIEGREDDGTSVIEHRLDVYENETKPLLELFKETGNLHVIDGMGDIQKIHQDIISKFK